MADVLAGLRSAIGENAMLAYIVMMSVRLLELHRVLKQTGSLFLHCDPSASHYLKIILDSIFKPENFRNEIIWKRSTGQKGSQHKPKKLGPIHDVILFYCKDNSKWIFVNPKKKLSKEELSSKFTNVDKNGDRWMDDSSHIFCSQGLGPRPNLCYEWKGFKNPHPSGWRLSKKRLEEEYKKGNMVIIKNKNGKNKIQRRIYEKDYKGENMVDLWEDVLPALGNEKMGYPTQKPLALLERIINSCSKKGDMVLDPFCGCGTTVHAAQKLDRRYIGIDITHLAIGLIEYRMKEAFGVRPEVVGVPTTLESAQELADRNKFQFETWAVTRIDGIAPNQKKGKDRGIDGRGYISVGVDNKKRPIYKKVIVSVKGGNQIGPAMVRDLKGTVEREKAAFGIFMCIKEPTPEMKREAATGGMFEMPTGSSFPKIQIYTIRDYFGGKKLQLPQIDDYVLGTTVMKTQVNTKPRIASLIEYNS